jgi:hypothetical protein
MRAPRERMRHARASPYSRCEQAGGDPNGRHPRQVLAVRSRCTPELGRRAANVNIRLIDKVSRSA